MTRARVKRRRVWAPPPRVYWILRRLSPLLMAAGMAASGWFLIRAILVWGVGGREYPFGADIPLSGAVVLLWSGTMFALLMPPASVLAHQSRPVADAPLVVWELGNRWRFWTVIAAPVCGLLGAFVPFAIPTALGSGPTIAPNLVGLLIAVPLTVGSVLMIWFVMRSILHGVELTPSKLVAHGYLRSQRFERGQVLDAGVVDANRWVSLMFTVFLRMDVDSALRLTLADGTQRVLYASNAHANAVERGAAVIRAWRASPRIARDLTVIR